MIRAMLWDIDNTLLNFDIAEKEALRIGFKEFGLGEFTDEMLDEYMNTKKAQTGKLKNSGFDKLFDLFFISEEIGAEKPSKKFFDVCIDGVDKWLIENEMTLPYSRGKYLGRINRNEIIMIGDSLTSDMKGANNAGIRSCWYNPDRHPVNQDVSVDMYITDLHEVMKCL